MNKFGLAAAAVLVSFGLGAGISTVVAQDAGSGWKVWIGMPVGGTKIDDAHVAIVRYNAETGETWFKHGKSFVRVAKPK